MVTADKLTISCRRCGRENVFDQPYAYHAGFSDVGFMYSDSGHFTLVWSAFDPAYLSFLEGQMPWTMSAEARARFEAALQDAPDGGHWSFSNPARCLYCPEPLSGPMTEQIYFLVYPGSVVTGLNGPLQLQSQLRNDAA